MVNIFGKRITFLRGTKSQKEMASLLGITQAYLSELERGKKLPSYDMLISIAKGYGTSVAYLMGETDDPGAQGTRENVFLFHGREDTKQSSIVTVRRRDFNGETVFEIPADRPDLLDRFLAPDNLTLHPRAEAILRMITEMSDKQLDNLFSAVSGAKHVNETKQAI